MTWVMILKKFWPAFVIVPLVFAVLFMRNSITSAQAERDAAQVRVAELNDANKYQTQTIADMAHAQADNDLIWGIVQNKLKNNTVSLADIRTELEKAKTDDPIVASWSNTPIPDSVRQALRARKVGSPAR